MTFINVFLVSFKANEVNFLFSNLIGADYLIFTSVTYLFKKKGRRTDSLSVVLFNYGFYLQTIKHNFLILFTDHDRYLLETPYNIETILILIKIKKKCFIYFLIYMNNEKT